MDPSTVIGVGIIAHRERVLEKYQQIRDDLTSHQHNDFDAICHLFTELNLRGVTVSRSAYDVTGCFQIEGRINPLEAPAEVIPGNLGLSPDSGTASSPSSGRSRNTSSASTMSTNSVGSTSTNATSVGSAELRDIFVFHTAYDPSPPPEYSCDHGFVVWASVAAFIACYESLQFRGIPCIVRLIGTPKGRTNALERQGVYDGANACVMVKPWPKPGEVHSYPTIKAELFVKKLRGDSIIHHEASFVGDVGCPPDFTHVMDCARDLAFIGYRALTDWTPAARDEQIEKVRDSMGRWRHLAVNGFQLGGPHGNMPLPVSLPSVEWPPAEPELPGELGEDDLEQIRRDVVV